MHTGPSPFGFSLSLSLNQISVLSGTNMTLSRLLSGLFGGFYHKEGLQIGTGEST